MRVGDCLRRGVVGTSRDRSRHVGRPGGWQHSPFSGTGSRRVTLGQLRHTRELDLRERMSTQDASTQNFPRMTSVDHEREQQTMGTFSQVSKGGG